MPTETDADAEPGLDGHGWFAPPTGLTLVALIVAVAFLSGVVGGSRSRRIHRSARPMSGSCST